MKSLVLLMLTVGGVIAADDEYATGRAGWGAFIIPVPLSVQADRGLVPGEGVLVLRVRPGGTADGLGVQPGDVVLDLNGQAVANWRNVRTIVRSSSAGDQLQAKIISDNGITKALSGEFKPRQPRRFFGSWLAGIIQEIPGGLASLIESPEAAVVRQNEELVRESRQLAEARAELTAIRATLTTPTSSAWYVDCSIHVGAKP
ncbi:MAG: PDZ domain-containing protein [Planctomycetota bacterium]